MSSRFWRWGDDPAELVALLRRGGVIGVPSESTYGLGVDPCDERGVSAVFRVKGRPSGLPLPVVIADLEQAAALGVARDAPGLGRVAALWPAPLSLVVPIARALPAAAGEASIALRIPDHPRLRALLARTGPLTATSANRHHQAPACDPDATAALLAEVEHRVIDDGRLPGGAPSTLVRWDGDGYRVLRSGRFPVERLPASLRDP